MTRGAGIPGAGGRYLPSELAVTQGRGLLGKILRGDFHDLRRWRAASPCRSSPHSCGGRCGRPSTPAPGNRRVGPRAPPASASAAPRPRAHSRHDTRRRQPLASATCRSPRRSASRVRDPAGRPRCPRCPGRTTTRPAHAWSHAAARRCDTPAEPRRCTTRAGGGAWERCSPDMRSCSCRCRGIRSRYRTSSRRAPDHRPHARPATNSNSTPCLQATPRAFN